MGQSIYIIPNFNFNINTLRTASSITSSFISPFLTASLSKKAHDVIRDELNFDGVIMTDDLQMSAIKNYYGESNSAILAVKSGNDLIISSDYQIQIPTVIEAGKFSSMDFIMLWDTKMLSAPASIPALKGIKSLFKKLS